MRARALVNGHVLPMAPDLSHATGLVWHEGRIVAVGDDAEAERHARRLGATPEDLDGRLVLPGFVDAHMHFLHAAVKRRRPDLAGARSRTEALARVRDWLAQHPGPGPVVAEGWDESEWGRDGRPTRAELDAITVRPLVLRRVCGHIAVANTPALQRVRAKWDDERVDAQSGLLLEEPSLYLNQVLPEPPERLASAIEAACRLAHTVGVTTLGDYSQAPFRQALRAAARAGRLQVRVASSIYPQDLDAELAAGFRTARPAPGPDGPAPSAWLRDGGLKLFLDGSLGGHTAHLREPYVDRPDTRGRPTFTDAQLRALVERADAAGVQVHAHAIGDAAIEQGLEAFARLAAARPPGERSRNPLRHRFEHFEVVDDGQARRTAALGIVACSQPNFVGEWSGAGGMYEERLGPRRALNNRFRSFRRAGVRLAFGSDGMPFGPLHGLACALGHPDPDERLGIEEAIALYTREAAWSLHWDDAVGTLAPGKRADLLVLDVHDPEERSPATWVLQETVVDGVVRHRGVEAVPHV